MQGRRDVSLPLFAIFTVPKLQDVTFNNNFGGNRDCYMSSFSTGFRGEKHVVSLTARVGIYTALYEF